jgi:DinB superfamily
LFLSDRETAFVGPSPVRRSSRGTAFSFSQGFFASCLLDRHQIIAFTKRTKEQVIVTNEELCSIAALNSWKLVISRFDQNLASLTDAQLQKQVAPGKNRLFYLVGHLTAVHDRLFPLLGIGERLHPELDEPYLTNPDRTLTDPVSASDLRKAWTEVNSKLTGAFEKFKAEDWLQKHADVSDEDFAKEPTRNRLAVVMSRTNHASFHSGQAVLAK